MPTLTIDGKQIEVPKGTRLIEAAQKVAVDVPYYCYHPGLSIAGNCRMCLVEIEKMPKLQIACHIEASEGMVVKTNTEKVLKTRQHILEFLLVNHPLDCPVCDQAGECWLQDYYMKHGLYDSRLDENKVKKPKAVSIGPTVMLDAERCILCSRCVRFTDEISKTSELGIVNRGDHSEITVFPEKELNNPYAGNVVDICPVGALTDKDFRFKIRVWYLKTADSICNGCSRGCNVQVQYNLDRPHHGKGDRVMRLKPRFNEKINQWWMCDEGRYGYPYHDKNRILHPMNRPLSPTLSPQAGRGSTHVPLTLEGRERGEGLPSLLEMPWAEIIPEIVKHIQSSQKKIGVFISPQLSNEEIFLARRLFRENLKLENLFLLSPNPPGFQDDFLIRADKNPNSKGAELFGFSYDDKSVANFFAACGEGKIEGVLVFGQDLLTLHGTYLAESALGRLKWSVFLGSNHNLMSEFAAYVLPSATYVETEGTFTNFEGRIQRFEKVLEPLGDARPVWEILIQLARKLGIHMHFDRAREIFEELSQSVEAFRGLSYEKLAAGGSDIRALASPVIPALEQESNIL